MDVKNNERTEKENLVKEMTLGQKIVEGRKVKKLSQEKFAEKMGCTRQMVSRWELDQSVPRTQKIKKISTILDISIEELMGEKADKSKKDSSEKKGINLKVIIKNVLICVITLAALYLLYSGYKYLILNSITSKVAEYENANNYHFVMESYIDKNINKKEEVWYKDGLYKIIHTDIVNNIESSTTMYLDINNRYRYAIDDENKTYSQFKLFNAEQYNNGRYMYSLFPLEIIKENNIAKEIAFKINKIFAYFIDKKLYLIINDEVIQLNKENLLPISQSTVFQENQNKIENFIRYNIELDKVTDEDVKIPNSYAKMN